MGMREGLNDWLCMRYNLGRQASSLPMHPQLVREPYMEKFGYTVEEAVEATTIGRSKLYELIASGEIESITIGRRRVIPADALRRFMDGLIEAARAAKTG
jgi:excisionase family DNA binding protein